MSENQPNRRLLALAGKWLSGNITAAERQEVEAWYNGFEDTRHELQSSETEKAMEARLKTLIDARAGIVKADKARSGSLRLAPYLKIAAAVAVITLGVWLYYSSKYQDSSIKTGGMQYANDIKPGKNTATLTLANGEVITLSEAKTGVVIDASKLSYSDGTEIKPAIGGGLDTKYSILNTISTPRGGTYQVVLPDGTKVWLNADSKISFPSQFSGKERKVVMEGEAYFEVTKNKLKPFIVESAGADSRPGQRVEVLGTHFNVNSYADEAAIRTTLLEGSVRVTFRTETGSATAGQTDGVTLRPGQQSIFYSATNGAAQLQAIEVNAEDAISWKNGKFIFSREPLSSIMRKVSRWYDVEINVDEDVANLTFSGSISRFDKISTLLEQIQKTNEVTFKITGRRIAVTR